MALVLGCGRERPAPVETRVVAVTNVIETTREVVVTNEVTVTVTNVVVERSEPVRVLSARKTAPYVVSAKTLRATQLRQLLSDAGARVVECDPGAVALVEASDKTVRALGELVEVKPLGPADKIAPDAGERVRVVPLSLIDLAAVTNAVRELGGEVEQVVTLGSPAVRARISYKNMRKLAERGDVRRIERDGK